VNDPQPSVEDLFHRLRALSATARAAFLDRELANDPAKRARVERLLAADIGDTSDFLAPKQPAPAPDVLGEKPGDAIDRYKLLQAIGEGGMGTVWMAEQKEPVVRKVALKIVKLGMDTREVVVRFEAERQALALMDHPHIAKVLDGGATPTGRPFFVMELVRGVPITDYCDQAKLGLRERLELFAKVCEAIQHAHHKGVIHRDIKPSNVLVTLHDGVPVPKVIDFGIAKATSAELTKKTLFTQYAQILGTPEYMAPEQAEMSGLDVDTRADVYSLGVLLYELLTGTKPFDIKTAMRVGFQELLRTIREDDPPRPSTRVSTLGEAASPVAARREVNVRAWSERLRGDLDWIVMKALEKDRTRRYDSPHGFAEDLARFLRDEAVAAAPPSAAYRLRKLVRRRRKTVAAGLVGALLLLGGLAGTSWGMWRASVEAGKARAAEALEHARANENDRIANFQATLLGGVDVPAMGVDLRKSLLAAAPAAERDELTQRLAAVNFTDLALGSLDSSVFQRSIRTIEEEFAAEPHMRARLLQVVGDTMRGLGLLQAARAPIERALALATATFGSGDPRTLSVLGSQMSLQLDANDFEAAERTGRRLLDGVQKALGDDDRDTMLAHLYLGKVLSARGALDEAATHLQRALDGLARFDGPDARTVLDVKNSLMVLTMRRGPTKEATRLARELLEQRTTPRRSTRSACSGRCSARPDRWRTPSSACATCSRATASASATRIRARSSPNTSSRWCCSRLAAPSKRNPWRARRTASRSAYSALATRTRWPVPARSARCRWTRATWPKRSAGSRRRSRHSATCSVPTTFPHSARQGNSRCCGARRDARTRRWRSSAR
jgi:non-specific serine/threonine protein kinase/serine/threonine-protein kinase